MAVRVNYRLRKLMKARLYLSMISPSSQIIKTLLGSWLSQESSPMRVTSWGKQIKKNYLDVIILMHYMLHSVKSVLVLLEAVQSA